MAINYNKKMRAAFYVLVNTLLVFSSFLVTYNIRFNIENFYADSEYFTYMKFVISFWVISEVIFRNWKEHQGWKFHHHYWLMVRTFTLFIFLCLGYIFLTKTQFVSRSFMILFLILSFFILNIVSYLKYVFLSYFRKRGKNHKRVLVIGPLPKGNSGTSSWNLLDPTWGYKIEDVIDMNMNSDAYMQVMEKCLTSKPYDEILITKPTQLGESIHTLIDFSENMGMRVKIVPHFLENFGERVQIDYLNGTPVINVRNEPLQYFHNRILKRAFDLSISLFFLITVYWWVHLIIAVAIKLTSRGPVLFKQTRIGVNNKPFVCYKFRTMTTDSGKNGSNKSGFGKITAKGDSRITKVGQFLRISNLDELPQFLNVLKGDMSIVGPRPHMLQEDQEIQDVVEKYRVRRFVKPGITGWAQINGFRGGTNDLSLMQKRIEHDIYYIERWSSLLDLKIIWKTAWQMVTFNTNAH